MQDLIAKPEDKRTTEEKAKLVHAMRVAGRLVRTKDVLRKLFNETAPKLKDRPGGYLRILKTGPRPGDAAPMAIVQLVDGPVESDAKDD